MGWQSRGALCLWICIIINNFNEGLTSCENGMFHCDNGNCVTDVFMCDKDDDCGDWSDEKNCTYSTGLDALECDHDEWGCVDNSVCVSLSMLCDGEQDCLDNSDEDDIVCHYHRKKCEDGHFLCKNYHCILEKWVCDGDDDCDDNSDEVGCFHHNTTLACTVANHFFKCNTGPTCIELQKVCDGENHCQDNSDEGPGCNSSRALCPHFGCDDECHALPTEPACTCKSGYDLVNNKKCRDIDECSTYGLCDQRCKNIPGSYECDCVEGYERRGNKCEAEGGEPLLLIARKTDIRAYYLKSGVRYTVTDNTDHAVGIAYDGKSVYWTNLKEGEEAIFRSDEHGINPQPIMVSGLEQPETLAIDWITGNIYFTDDGPKHIAVCTHDAKMCTVLVNENIDRIRGLVLLIPEGRMFWSDWGENATISEACMDGTDRKVFVAKDIQWPNGLALDYGNYRLYWADAKLGTLESIRLDGSDRRVILEGVADHPYSVAVFEDRLYWSDWIEREVKSCHKFTGKNMTVVAKSSRSMIYNIQVYHSAAHPEIPNPCVNSLCSDICLLSNHTEYSCACPPHKQLGNDKHICRDMDNIEEIVVASVNHLYIIEHQVLGNQTVTEMNLHMPCHIKAMTYNSLTGELLIYDMDNMKIIAVDIRSRQTLTLLSPVSRVEAMDFDYLGNNLYWCNKILSTVEVMSFYTRFKTVLIQYPTDTDLLSLAVVPEEGLMFVAVDTGPNLFIERMQMDGKGERTHIIDEDLVGPHISLSYDPTLHRIFWTDMGRGTIESTDVDGIDRHKLQVFAAQPMYIAILGRHVFWTNLDIPKLYWTDKFNGMSKVKQLPLDIDLWDPGFYTLAAITGKRARKPHICRNYNGGCSHICLLALKNVECACPAGQTLDNTNKTCVFLADCKNNQFKCVADNLCISFLSRCDGKKDCPSGADEDMCPRCGKDEFQCKNGFCIISEQKCDGNFDCDDYSDESECDGDCSSAMMFLCKSGGCVPKSHRCDGAMDCSDGSDEADCQRDCSESQFKCKKSERCIPKQWECDGEYDCDDQSDEHFDCTQPTCSPKEFSCRNGHCVDKILHCNGVDECGDRSDELHCWDHNFNKTVPHCTEDHYICKFNATICLPRSARCNGTVECPKGEDEMDCGCLEDEFECQNGKCISPKWVCDSVNDCGDSSDELSTLCAHWGRTPDAGPHTGRCPEFSCLTTGQCVPLSSVCNKEKDCLDGSDEGGECDRSCDTIFCEQVCHKTPFGPKCSCTQGFAAQTDGRTCLDIDECSLNACSQLCINTVGSYMCDCLEGYVLRSDKTSCKASGEPMEFIYTAFNQIRKLKPRSNTMGIVFNGQDLQITGLDVDVINRTVYWSYEVTGTVNRISVDGHNKVTIGNVGHPTKLAVDWVTKNVYVIDEDNVQRLKVCNLDVKKCSVLLEMEEGGKITGIAVDPISGLLIWSQAFWGKLKKPISYLHSCDLSGRNRKMIAKDISFVNGIALDLSNKRLFWIDERSKVIETIRYDGENRHNVTKYPVILAKGLVQFEGFLHWLTKGSDYITKFRLYGQTNYQRIPIHVHNSELFTILQTARQPRRPNKCENVTCSHMCVLNVGYAQCICPDGTLVEEQQHCIGKKDKTIHIVTPDYEAHASGNTAVIVLMILLLILVVLGSVYWFFFYKKRPVGDLNIRLYFNESIYRIRELLNIKAWRKGESDETEHEYVNPVIQAEHAVAISESSEATCKKAPKAVKFTKRRVGMTQFENDSDDETDETDNAYLVH